MDTLRLKDGDLCLCGFANIQMLTGVDAVMQTCENYALAMRGEMVLQKREGMPFFEAVFNGQPNAELYESVFRRRMLEVDGVVSVQAFDATVQDGALRYNATIETIYGIGNINGGV